MQGVKYTVFGKNTIGNNLDTTPDITVDMLYLKNASTTSYANFTIDFGSNDVTFAFTGIFESTFNQNTFYKDFLSANAFAPLTEMNLVLNGELIENRLFPSYVHIKDVIEGETTAIKLQHTYYGDDIFIGSTSANQNDIDYVFGYDGNDRFYGYGDPDGLTQTTSDTFHGGNGTDIACYRGPISNYTIEKVDWIWNPKTNSSELSGYHISDKSNLDGDDVLYQVERLQFSNISVALDTDVNQSAGQAALLLATVLPGQLAFDVSKQALMGTVIGLLDQGFTLEQLSGAVLRLPIWEVLTGKIGPTIAEIATYLVHNVHGGLETATITSSAISAMNAETTASQGTFLASLTVSEASQNHANLMATQSHNLIDIVGTQSHGLAYLV